MKNANRELAKKKKKEEKLKEREGAKIRLKATQRKTIKSPKVALLICDGLGAKLRVKVAFLAFLLSQAQSKNADHKVDVDCAVMRQHGLHLLKRERVGLPI
jgi:hypothetical protein